MNEFFQNNISFEQVQKAKDFPQELKYTINMHKLNRLRRNKINYWKKHLTVWIQARDKTWRDWVTFTIKLTKDNWWNAFQL